MWAKVRGQRNNSVGIRETEWAAKSEAQEQSVPRESEVPKRRRQPFVTQDLHSDVRRNPRRERG